MVATLALALLAAATDRGSPRFVQPEERIATFDQDGTLWVSHPMYTQVVYCLDRVPAGMTTDRFQAEVKSWIATARDPRWKRPGSRPSRWSAPPRA